uniref:Uncharacterized protein n=1 Tax=Leviviridae sp. TaxID=2027243 RepID=A0A514DAY4_9VIRU|nr:MAG: hypothetical protein H2RhizoL491704e2950_000002 [Leviviridae sp.]
MLAVWLGRIEPTWFFNHVWTFVQSLNKEMPSVFADPQSITINAIANSLPRVAQGVNTATYSLADRSIQLLLSHQFTTSRARHTVRLNHKQLTADPYSTGSSFDASMSAYLVIDVPLLGYTQTVQKQVVDGLTLFTTTSTGANITKILGGES